MLRFFILSLFLLLQTEGSKRPNVVLIICDDLNDYVETLGGHPQAKTPHMRRLMERGVSFTQAHCNIPICNPSRASFITGLYPHTSQLYGFEKWRDNEITKNSRTLMDHFRKNGYHTLGTGKIMHNGERQEWIHYQNDADYSPLAHREGKNIAHPDIPAPFRDEFEAIDGSFGPLRKVKAPFSWKSGNWKRMKDFRYESEDDRDLTADELNGKWAVENLKKLAKKLDADGCHLGQRDMNIIKARKILKKKIIGITCHNSLNLAKKAIKNSANYLAFGAFYSSNTKKIKYKANIKILNSVKKITNTPIVAIGGIKLENYKKLLLNKANFLAISGYIWNNKKYKPFEAIKKFK